MTKLRQLWLLTAFGSLAVLLLGWFVLVAPKSDTATAVRAEAESQLTANKVLQNKIKDLTAKKTKLPELQDKLNEFAKLIPANPSLPGLVRQLSAAADASGVVLAAVTPSVPTLNPLQGATPIPNPAPGVAVAQVPLNVTVGGSYSEMTAFFDELEKLPRALIVDVVKVTTGTAVEGQAVADGENMLKAEIGGHLFMTAKAPAAPAPTGTAAETNAAAN